MNKFFKKYKKTTIGLSGLIIILGLFLVYQALSGKSADQLYNFIEIEKGEVIQLVSVTGTVTSDQSLNLQFEQPGQVARVEVSVGQEVKAGQLLMSLSQREAQAQLQEAAAALQMSQARLAKILAGSRPEEISVYETAVVNAENNLLAAETNLTIAEQNLIDVKAGAENSLNQAYENGLDSVGSNYTKADKTMITFANIRESYFSAANQLGINIKNKELIAKNSLEEAKLSLNQAENYPSEENIDLALVKLKSALIDIREALFSLRSGLDDPLVYNGVSTTDLTSVDTERTTIDISITAITTAQQTIATTKISNQTNINSAQATVDQRKDSLTVAETNLRRAQDELNLKKADPVQADIDLARAEVAQARANLAKVQDRLTKYVLRAPIDGIITKLNYKVGETVTGGQSAITLINEKQFQIESNVSETDISKLQLGDEVEMTLDAFGSEEKFIGQVIEIDPAETVVSGVIYYRVKSAFSYEDSRIRSGMTVNLDILTDKKDDVLYLPYYAIKQRNGFRYVEILADNQIIEKEVTVGLEGETRIEISGTNLNPGQKVITGKK